MESEYDRLIRDFSWNIPTRYNLGEAISDRQADQGHDTAIILVDEDWSERRVSFRHLGVQSNRLANWLVANGRLPGDRIAVMLPACVEAAICHIGILKAGMIAVPILPNLKGDAIAERLEVSGASVVFTSEQNAENWSDIWPSLPNLRQVQVVSDSDGIGRSERLDRLLANASSVFHVMATRPGDPALLGFTSGSEGRPKGVLHAHSITLGGLPSLLFSEVPHAGHVAWSHFEWGWLGGILVAFGAWHCGTSILIHNQPVMVPGQTIELLRRSNVNHVSIAPTALKMIRQTVRSAEFPKLTSITSGGEKLDIDTRDWVRARFGIALSEIYGLSECGAVLGSGHILPVREGAIGKPAPGQLVHVMSETGEKLGPHETGLIAVSAPHPSLFLGYWEDPEATARKYRGMLYNTGDLGYYDEDGYFWYVSRGDDIISSAGHRVGPAEIEDAIAAIDGVSLCAAVGVPDPVSGEKIVVWIELAEGFVADAETEEAIMAAARTTLALHQMPRRVVFVDKIPRTTTGKVHRREVREQEISGES